MWLGWFKALDFLIDAFNLSIFADDHFLKVDQLFYDTSLLVTEVILLWFLLVALDDFFNSS
jgi:hypothetical protein